MLFGHVQAKRLLPVGENVADRRGLPLDSRMEESAFDTAYALLVEELDDAEPEPETPSLDDAWFDVSEEMLATLPGVEDQPRGLAAWWASL